jgi:hypothetical protein
VPGTELARDAPRAGQAAFRALGKALIALRITPGPAEAGRLMAETMTGPRPAESGAYISKGKVIPSSSESYDEQREEELWTAADELCGIPRQASPGQAFPR